MTGPNRATAPGKDGARPSPGLAALLAPLDVAEFRASYLERRHVRIPGAGKELPLRLEDIDMIMSSSSVRSSDLRVVADGRETAVSDLAPPGDATALELLYDCYRKGSTIVFKFLNERWEPLSELCHALGADLDARTQVNVYLTPPGARGLTPHFDTHDVFVLQVHGVKHWRLYESAYPLPILGQSYAQHRAGPDPGPPIEEFDMHPGDVLYMPRGCVHDATSAEGASLHLTIGMLPVLWCSVIRDAVELAIERDVRLRRALPAGFAKDPLAHKETEAAVGDLLASIAGQVGPRELLDRAAQRADVTRRPELRGHLLDLEAERSLGTATKVHRRTGVECTLDTDAGSARLRFHGKQIDFPARVADDLTYVVGAVHPFTAGDLPGSLDEHGRVVLLRVLVHEGLLSLR